MSSILYAPGTEIIEIKSHEVSACGWQGEDRFDLRAFTRMQIGSKSLDSTRTTGAEMQVVGQDQEKDGGTSGY